jgi:hypothetical protein
VSSHHTGVLDALGLLALEADEPRDKAAGIVGRLACYTLVRRSDDDD